MNVIMKKLFISMLISAICVISISATASPVIYEKQKSQVSDVSCKSKIVIQEFKFSQEAVSIVSRAKYNEVSIPI